MTFVRLTHKSNANFVLVNITFFLSARLDEVEQINVRYPESHFFFFFFLRAGGKGAKLKEKAKFIKINHD